MQNGSSLRQVATVIFILAFSGGRGRALIFPRSPVGAVHAVLYAMGAMLPPIPPSISFLIDFWLIFGKFSASVNYFLI